MCLHWDDGTRTLCYPAPGGYFKGANITLMPKGNLINVMPTASGLSRLAYPSAGGVWQIGDASENGAGGTGTPGGTPTPPSGTYKVIFPTTTHNVSDSFQDHINRGSVNPGTDYTAPYGSVVVAVSAGVVTDVTATYGGSGGRMIHIDHDDGSGADYLHLSDSTSWVSVGTHVAQGQQIALSGASGYGSNNYYGAHLHISYRTVHGYAYQNHNSIDFDALVRSEGLT
jgi:murein DD-endopeptidase MepM/ murein hydrolase activator NlpD